MAEQVHNRAGMLIVTQPDAPVPPALVAAAASAAVEPVKAAILGDVMPKSEAGVPVPGSADKAPRTDHQHPSISWRGAALTNAQGVATFDFSAKPFDMEPVYLYGYFEGPTALSVVSLRVSEWVIGAAGQKNAAGADVAGKWIGAKLQAQRSALNLLNINIFSSPAAGLKTTLIVLPPSQ